MTMQPQLPDFDLVLWLMFSMASTLILCRVADLASLYNGRAEREAAFLEREGRA
jgi:hypothetical protein